jgi:biopolymer transport protein ExbD
MSHKVKVELPQATLETRPELDQPPITLAVQSNGKVYWDDEEVTADLLEARLAVLAQRTPQPQVDIRADNVTRYGLIQDVVRKVRLAGIRKVGFVSTPER